MYRQPQRSGCHNESQLTLEFIRHFPGKACSDKKTQSFMSTLHVQTTKSPNAIDRPWKVMLTRGGNSSPRKPTSAKQFLSVKCALDCIWQT
mmetsp:Transcript_62229/g.91221  ORF Transcript_62229/g.91221 Transcript_62229/m.91221 type:complete len:91 (-) Transcript_62229:855-1127(-)